MPERDPYDFSALAEELEIDFDEGPDDLARQQFVLSEEAFAEMADFEADFEAMAAEGFAMPGEAELEAQFQQLQAVIQQLSTNLVDPQLDADEAWLAALLLEEAAEPNADEFDTPGDWEPGT